jgi:hypothetical protein
MRNVSDMIDNIEYPVVVILVMGMFALTFTCGFILSVCVLISRWHAVSTTKRLHYIAIVVCGVGAVNFICGMGIVESLIMGGGALIGKFEQGQYYLGQWGDYTPVSSSTFSICKYYEVAVLLTFSLSAIAACITYCMQEEPKETLSSKVIDEMIKKRKN